MGWNMSKVTSLQDAARVVQDGQTLSFSGFAHSLVANAFARELIRQRKRDLSLIAMGEAWIADLLAGSHSLREVWMSNFMFEGFGLCRYFVREVEAGRIQVHDYSHFGISLALQASALGIPWLPTHSMLGTDLSRQTRQIDGENVVLALKPDIAVLHTHLADEEGNMAIRGVSGISELLASAARRVIVTTEHLVTGAEFKRLTHSHDMRVIAGMTVSEVVCAPWGSHPAGMYGVYDLDRAAISEYLDLAKADRFDAYADRFIFSPRDHYGYLETFGASHLLTLRADPTVGYGTFLRRKW